MKRMRQNYTLVKWLAVATASLGRYSERLSALPARILWFTPWEVPVSERGRAKQAGWLRDAEPRVFTTAFGKISAFSAGSGPVVLLVHGWGESAASLGGFITPLTRAGFQVIGMDLPAHGASSGRRTNVPHAGDAIRAVADAIGDMHAVVAHSMGANALLWAIRRGLPLQRTVLLAPNVDLSFALESFEALFSLPPKAIRGLRRSIERRFGSSIWVDIRGDELARGLEVPGLVFHDPDDPVVPFIGAQRLVGAWPAAELIEVRGLGHGTITRDPEVIERACHFISSPAGEGAHSVSAKVSPRRGISLGSSRA